MKKRFRALLMPAILLAIVLSGCAPRDIVIEEEAPLPIPEVTVTSTVYPMPTKLVPDTDAVNYSLCLIDPGLCVGTEFSFEENQK